MANESDAQPPRMTDCEKRLARKWYKEGVERVEIASRLGRQLSGVVKFLKQKVKPQPLGRPKLLSVADVDGLVKTLEKMVDEADATYEVSALMLHKASKLKCSIRTMADAVHERGYYFRDLRHKPILTPEDIKDRKRFAAKYKDKSKEWWRSAVHIHLDNHMFKMATKQSGRKLLAKRRVRGVYRKKGKSLRSGHVKPDPKLKLYTGGKGVLKAGGVGGGKVLVWHTLGRWNGEAAANVYNNVIAPALSKRYADKKKFLALEDNDPTGNQSKKAIAAKKENKIHIFSIPKRSPELNVLDYAIWSQVEKRLRKQEKNFPSNKTETRATFEARLDRTAKRLPSSFIDRAIGNMKERCQRLFDAKGALFEEGGNKK